MTSFKASKKDSEKSQFKSCFRLAHGCLIVGSTDTLNWNDFFPQKNISNMSEKHISDPGWGLTYSKMSILAKSYIR